MMIELKERRRRTKRKFSDPLNDIDNDEIGCTAAGQPKETLLDMSVSKLAKAKTRVNLEPSLRKTVMIVNTIRKLERQLENNTKDITTFSEPETLCDEHYVNSNTRALCDTRNRDHDNIGNYSLPKPEESVNSTEQKFTGLTLCSSKGNKQYACENNTSTDLPLLDNSRYRSFGVEDASSTFDLKRNGYSIHFAVKTKLRSAVSCFTATSGFH